MTYSAKQEHDFPWQTRSADCNTSHSSRHLLWMRMNDFNGGIQRTDRIYCTAQLLCARSCYSCSWNIDIKSSVFSQFKYICENFLVCLDSAPLASIIQESTRPPTLAWSEVKRQNRISQAGAEGGQPWRSGAFALLTATALSSGRGPGYSCQAPGRTDKSSCQTAQAKVFMRPNADINVAAPRPGDH